MKFVLILMVRNESRILERCLKSVESFVDAFCIHDTGSTDNTVEIARKFLEDGKRKGSITESVWKDFGTNRTASFQAAQDYLKSGDWDLSTTYGLLLDADMVFHPEKLKDHPLGEIGYSVIQSAGTLEYPNTRLIRMDYAWKCIGVTHEYWDGVTQRLGQEVCWIEDQNDGGCKADKFERDARLLEAGLVENPKNERYMFYLAQTYHSLGRWKDSIAMYKKRFAAGGWDEEKWYSLYMIADGYLKLKDPLKFELYMQKAMLFRPGRAEAPYALTKYFREVGDHYKAWYYALRGRSLPVSADALFIDKSVYTGKFDYEATILLYYIGKHEEGLHETMKYLLTKSECKENVFQNLVFYVKPIGKGVPFPVDRNLFGPDFHPGSVCLWKSNGILHANVRFVNYRLDAQTRNIYEMCQDGHYSTSHLVRTENAYVSDGRVVRMQDASVPLPRMSSHIRGLEDVRVYTDGKGELRFLATQREYSEKNRILGGIYDARLGRYRDCAVYEPPTPTECEKNWLPIEGTNDIVYAWHPLRVGQLSDNKLVVKTTHETPWFFRHLRGSAVPFRVDSELWALVHCVEYSTPRKYFHCMAVLDAATYKPLRISLPFAFRAVGIEYCIGMRPLERAIEFVFSSWDDNPCITEIALADFEWLQV
jgi:glycosyltransferase involved in cell wall biosynthesis